MEKFTFIEWVKNNKAWAAIGLLATIGIIYAISLYWGDAIPAPSAIQSDIEDGPVKPPAERGNIVNPTTKTDVIIGRDKLRGKGIVGKIGDKNNQYL